jgi:CRISPR-associated endonuclease/helicase Cas3
MMHWAHTLPDRPEADWQLLDDHLPNVAGLAAELAQGLDLTEWARIGGLWHDVGKFSREFQNYLRSVTAPDSHCAQIGERIDHATAGAQHAVGELPVLGHLLAYAIAGHHSGLLDWLTDGKGCQKARLGKRVPEWKHEGIHLPQVTEPDLPHFLKEALVRSRSDPKGAAFSFQFFVRMIFSCLVDADFLDTERFMAPERAQQRPCWPADILAQMQRAVDAYVADLQARGGSLVSAQRRLVHEQSTRAATREPGFFSLTVPTGGGKTLSSLAFALRHAQRFDNQRVVYVIPFTSIIEQNATVFRTALSSLVGVDADEAVLEHHSNLELEDDKDTTLTRLATQNWDAPLVVTTAVQFYESLFASRTSRCRKLHNIARSVIVLDEAQTLPVDLLEPCLLALRELCANYRCSVVLCTATQPAIQRRNGFPIGIEGVREIIEDVPALYNSLERVTVENIGMQSDDKLSERLLQHEQVLCVVNTRGHARALYERVRERGAALHLSAQMYPAHRTELLREARARLSRHEPCRLISTQLIEAGVDIDFPVVYRSLAGLDSVAQAAGRCNRNGLLKGKGTTFLFRSEHAASEAFLRDTTNATAQLLTLFDDFLSLEAVQHYFRLYYWEQQARWDNEQVLSAFRIDHRDGSNPFMLNFATAARKFQLIRDAGQAVIVPGEPTAQSLCEELRRRMPPHPRKLLTRLQRYSVQVRQGVATRWIGRGLEVLHDRYVVLVNPETSYSPELGLVLDEPLTNLLEV